MKKSIKEIVKTAGILKLVPNTLTLCNSLCGFAAILYSLRVYDSQYNPLTVFYYSAWIIFFAMIFDACDGYAARLLNAASLTGIQMDSLSDMVTFGVAPATLVAIMTKFLRTSLTTNQEVLVYFLCAVYLGGAALRLATYNVHAMVEHKSSEKFSGLPSPGAAAAICIVVIFARDCGFSLDKLAFVLPVYAAVLGLLMVSSIPYTHMGKWIFTAHHHPWRILVLVAALIIVAVFRVPALTIMVTGYVLSGPVAAGINLGRKLFGGAKTEVSK